MRNVPLVIVFLMAGDPYEIKFRQSMDSLNYFLEDMQISNDLRLQDRSDARPHDDNATQNAQSHLVVGATRAHLSVQLCVCTRRSFRHGSTCATPRS